MTVEHCDNEISGIGNVDRTIELIHFPFELR